MDRDGFGGFGAEKIERRRGGFRREERKDKSSACRTLRGPWEGWRKETAQESSRRGKDGADRGKHGMAVGIQDLQQDCLHIIFEVGEGGGAGDTTMQGNEFKLVSGLQGSVQSHQCMPGVQENRGKIPS